MLFILQVSILSEQMKKSDARKKNEKNEKKNTKKTCFFPEKKKHEMKKTVFFTTLGMRPAGPGRSSSRLGGWNSGLTEESPCGSATR